MAAPKVTYCGFRGDKLDLRALAAYARNAGFTGKDIPIAAAVAMAESRGYTAAIGDCGIGGSFGLWQIYAKVHGGKFTGDWKSPVINAKMARQVFTEAGNSWRPWTTYKTGAYRVHLIPATAAAATLPNGGSFDLSDFLTDVRTVGEPLEMPGLPDPMAGIRERVDVLTDPNTWLRAGYVIGGTALVIVAALLFGADTMVAHVVKKASKVLGPVKP